MKVTFKSSLPSNYHSLLPTDLDSTVYTTKPENYYSYFYRDNSGTDHGRFFSDLNIQMSLQNHISTAWIRMVHETYEDNTEASPYLVVAKSQKEDDHTEEEAAPYLVVAKFQKEDDHTEEEAALYSVVYNRAPGHFGSTRRIFKASSLMVTIISCVSV